MRREFPAKYLNVPEDKQQAAARDVQVFMPSRFSPCRRQEVMFGKFRPLFADKSNSAKTTMTSPEDQATFEELELRLRTILPEEYQDCYEDVQPTSMGSASLKYARDGKVAWNDVWVTFCDLAMAGGPPHKGALLEPGSRAELDAQPDRYREVAQEICRGITMVTDLEVAPSSIPGWVRVECASRSTAEWLVRAIVMENVSAHHEDTGLHLPAGPAYRVEKEIKNVCHRNGEDLSLLVRAHVGWRTDTNRTIIRKDGDRIAAYRARSRGQGRSCGPAITLWQDGREHPPTDRTAEVASPICQLAWRALSRCPRCDLDDARYGCKQHPRPA